MFSKIIALCAITMASALDDVAEWKQFKMVTRDVLLSQCSAMQCTFFIFFLPFYFFTHFLQKNNNTSLQLFLLNGFTSFQTFGKTYAAEEEAKRFEIFKVRTVSLRCNTVVLPKPVELIIKCAQKLNLRFFRYCPPFTSSRCRSLWRCSHACHAKFVYSCHAKL